MKRVILYHGIPWSGEGDGPVRTGSEKELTPCRFPGRLLFLEGTDVVFSSIIFLFRFLPIVLLIYYLCPFRLKNAVILIASLIFYAWGEPRFILLMFASILADYCAGLGIEFCRKRGVRWGTRAFLGLSLVFNLGSLGFFKYAGFFLDNLRALGFAAPVFSVALPLGISFYTFQTMSYSIDVSRGAVKA